MEGFGLSFRQPFDFGDSMAFLTGKKILITGLLSNRSIAYGIAQAAQREGAELAFTFQGEAIKDRVVKLASHSSWYRGFRAPTHH